MHLLSKLFFRLILPIVLAVALSIWWMFGSLGQARRGFFSSGSGWGWPYRHVDARIVGITVAAIFSVVFAINLSKTLKWGKEGDEYAELLKEQADEMGRRSEQDVE